MYIDTYENQNSMLITKEALTSQEKQNMSQIVTVPDKYAIKKEIRGRQLKNPLSVSQKMKQKKGKRSSSFDQESRETLIQELFRGDNSKIEEAEMKEESDE